MNAPPIHGILETILYASDLPAMRTFYTDVIGLEEVAYERGRHVFFRCGAGMLLIFDPQSTLSTEVRVGDAVIPSHGAIGPGHLAFAVAAESLEDWELRLTHANVEIESMIGWYADRPHIRSIYFRDPAENSIELTCPELWGNG